jgi:hypothetical protein
MSQAAGVHEDPASPWSPASTLHMEPRRLPPSRTAPPVHGVSATHAATQASRRVSSNSMSRPAAAVFPLAGGNHPITPVLLATDLAAAREFYHGTLGLQIVRKNENAIVFSCGSSTHRDVTKSATGTADGRPRRHGRPATPAPRWPNSAPAASRSKTTKPRD